MAKLDPQGLKLALTAVSSGADLVDAARVGGLDPAAFLEWAKGEGREKVESRYADLAVYAQGAIFAAIKGSPRLAEKAVERQAVRNELSRLKRVARLQESDARTETHPNRAAGPGGQPSAPPPA